MALTISVTSKGVDELGASCLIAGLHARFCKRVRCGNLMAKYLQNLEQQA